MRQALTTLAEQFGGDYDGWEAAVTPTTANSVQQRRPARQDEPSR